MLHIKPFTGNDLSRIQALSKSRKLYFIFGIICVPMTFLLGLTGLLPQGLGYWYITFLLLFLFLLASILASLRSAYLENKDLREQTKLCGVITVAGKAGTGNVLTTSPELKKFSLSGRKAFEKIAYGDKLYIEISKHCKHIFRLEKEGENLL